MSSSAFSKKPNLYNQAIQSAVRASWYKQVFFGTKNFLHSTNLQATIQAAGFLRVLPKSPFKKLLLGTGLWQHTYVRMSTNLKSPDMLKDAKCKKGQLSQLLGEMHTL